MSDAIWRVMVEMQISRRDRSQPATHAPRRSRPPTLRSIRELLIDDHYAILTAGEY